MGRRVQILLLITVVVSNLLLGVHVATHFSAGSVECELCAAYSDPSHAIAVDGIAEPLFVPDVSVPTGNYERAPRSSIFTTRPRGPPSLI